MIASKQARGRDDIEILELAVHRPPGVKRPSIRAKRSIPLKKTLIRPIENV
jgi:hypothetical protein